MTARPFLKWAGGKSQLLEEIGARIPDRFRRYHEPFVGGGALFFALRSHERLAGATLSDRNPWLVEAYQTIRDGVDEIIAALKRHENTPEHFYQVRAQDPAKLTPSARAARLIYLNKTCFNGLYRENRAGQFNVPFGRYTNPKICDEDNLREVASALKGVDIVHTTFAAVLGRAERGDFVYFDPPYQPVSPTASFTSYVGHGFGEEEQRKLREVYASLAARGVHVLLSNSDTPLIRELYRDFHIDRVFATRAINSKADRRGKVPEVLVRSYARTATRRIAA